MMGTVIMGIPQKEEAYMSENGAIQYNRRKGWELAFAACANTVPTLFVILMTFTTYIGTGVYGATTVLAGTIVTGSRIFDAITDPLIAWRPDLDAPVP